MNKRIIPLVLLSSAMLLVGCGNKNSSQQGGSGANPGTSTSVPAQGTVVEFVAADYPSATSSAFQKEKSGVTVAVSNGTVDVEHDCIRVFKSATLTISGSAFTKVDFSFSDYTYTKEGKTTYYDGRGIGTGAPEGFTLAADNLTGTWSGNSTSLTFTMATAQVRPTKISVTLA